MFIKVLLADHVDFMRRAIRGLLEDEPRIQIVGEASDFSQTLSMTEKLNPQITVMDICMPRPASLAPLEVRSRLAMTRLLAISVFADDDTWAMADSFGAAKLLEKMRLGSELIPTIIELSSVKGARAVAELRMTLAVRQSTT